MEDETSAEDELMAENELLKLKLEMEHGMSHSETGDLPPEVENEWLNYIYNFEKAHKEAGRIKVYEFIGSPTFKKAACMPPDELSAELERLFHLMGENGICIDFICDYDDIVMYQFITEELFEHEMDNVRIKGMTTNFIYEEFHPNHDYDLREDSVDFIEDLLKHSWKEEFSGFKLCKTVLFNGTEYDRHGISEIILQFQEAHKGFEITETGITEAGFNLEEGNAKVSIQLTYKAQLPDDTYSIYTGQAVIQFKYDGDYWSISGFSLPGLL